MIQSSGNPSLRGARWGAAQGLPIDVAAGAIQSSGKPSPAFDQDDGFDGTDGKFGLNGMVFPMVGATKKGPARGASGHFSHDSASPARLGVSAANQSSEARGVISICSLRPANSYVGASLPHLHRASSDPPPRTLGGEPNKKPARNSAPVTLRDFEFPNYH